MPRLSNARRRKKTKRKTDSLQWKKLKKHLRRPRKT